MPRLRKDDSCQINESTHLQPASWHSRAVKSTNQHINPLQTQKQIQIQKQKLIIAN
jgi:hypothetical protein